MRQTLCLVILLILVASYLQVSEGFTGFQVDYGTGIGPWWAQGPGLKRGFHRCKCFSSGSCTCLNNRPSMNTSIYPQYYFN